MLHRDDGAPHSERLLNPSKRSRRTEGLQFEFGKTGDQGGRSASQRQSNQGGQMGGQMGGQISSQMGDENSGAKQFAKSAARTVNSKSKGSAGTMRGLKKGPAKQNDPSSQRGLFLG